MGVLLCNNKQKQKTWNF